MSAPSPLPSSSSKSCFIHFGSVPDFSCTYLLNFTLHGWHVFHFPVRTRRFEHLIPRQMWAGFVSVWGAGVEEDERVSWARCVGKTRVSVLDYVG